MFLRHLLIGRDLGEDHAARGIRRHHAAALALRLVLLRRRFVVVGGGRGVQEGVGGLVGLLVVVVSAVYHCLRHTVGLQLWQSRPLCRSSRGRGGHAASCSCLAGGSARVHAVAGRRVPRRAAQSPCKLSRPCDRVHHVR